MVSTYKIKIQLLGNLNSYERYNTFIKFTKSHAISSSVEMKITHLSISELNFDNIYNSHLLYFLSAPSHKDFFCF